jgi:hypothetical protein
MGLKAVEQNVQGVHQQVLVLVIAPMSCWISPLDEGD